MRSENLDLSLSVPHNPRANGYIMNDQTFHTPSFGDEEFDIPPIHSQHAASGLNMQTSHIQYAPLHHSAPQMGMMNPAQDGLAPPGGAPSYQQPLYLQEPHTPITQHATYSSPTSTPAGNYIIQQQPGGQQRLLMMQPASVMAAPPAPHPPASHPAPPPAPVPQYGRSPQRASPPGATTSDDSDDSVPSHHAQLPGDAESLLPIHYCSASRQQAPTIHQLGVGNTGLKRPSPEPVDNGINRGQLPKKPKVQKKKKKRDPNEPQKPVSAYALFFRDTQAAIKGQNPNASFGEVSKIVASMWDGLDSEHKSVYKQKTEAAKKEYLKALAAYRASLVSKGNEQETQPMYNHTSGSPTSSYGGYYPSGGAYGSGQSPQQYASSAPQGYNPQGYPAHSAPSGFAPGHSPGYQPNATHSPQAYQSGTGQSPQNYQNNPSQSPQTYGSGHSPQGYRIAQSQSPPMMPPHPMHYHHHSQNISSPQRPAPRDSPLHSSGAVAQHHSQVSMQMQQQVRHHQQQQQQIQQQQMQQQQQIQQQIQQQNHQQHNHQQPNHQPQQQNHQQQNHQQQNQQQQHQQPQQQNQQPNQQQQNQQQNQQQQGQNNNGSSGTSQGSPEGESAGTPSCIRDGCTNPAVANSEWEDEYCSNECVVSHCRDVFSSWVASNNNQNQNFSAVK